jgi:hypothetical protein
MLTERSLDVQDCLQLAAACELEAAAREAEARVFFLDLAARCLRVAENFEHIERVGRFLTTPRPY